MGTKTPQQHEDEVSALVEHSLGRAQKLLRQQMDEHDRPFDAFVTLTLSVAVLARALGMPLETFLEGAGAAYNSLEEVEVPHVH